MERIDIKHFDLANENLTESNHLYIELGDNYLIYAADYYSEVPVAEDQDDHTLGWKDRYNYFIIKIKRESFVSIDLNWLEKRQLYRVELEANGYPNTVTFYFKTQKEAEAVYKKLDAFIF